MNNGPRCILLVIIMRNHEHDCMNPDAGVQMIAIAVELVPPRASACRKRLAMRSFLRLCTMWRSNFETIGKLGLAQEKDRKDTEPVFKLRCGSCGCPFPPLFVKVEFLYSRHERVFMLLLFIQFLLEVSWGDV